MRRLGLAVLAAIVVALGAGTVAAAAAPCPPLDYLAGLNRAQAALLATPPDVATAVTQLVQLEQAYPPAAATLAGPLDALRATSPRVADARSRIDTIAGTLALPRGSTCNADQRPARSALNGVYQSPVFANLDHKAPGQNPIGQFLQWLSSLLRNVTGALGPAGSIALGAVLVGGALALAAWRLRRVLGSRPVRLAAAREAESDDPDREWARASDAASRGDYREAVRRAFRSALLTVADRGRLAVDPSWTTHELLAATRGDGGLLAALAPAAAVFDRAWYSGAPVTEADWEQARERCAALRRLARARAQVET